MGLAHSGRTEKDEVTAFVQKACGGQLLYQARTACISVNLSRLPRRAVGLAVDLWRRVLLLLLVSAGSNQQMNQTGGGNTLFDPFQAYPRRTRLGAVAPFAVNDLCWFNPVFGVSGCSCPWL